MSSDSRLLQPAALVRRVLFFVLLVAMTLIQLFVVFSGLTSAEGIEQAQVAREISRGNGFSTQVVRPIALAQGEQNQPGQLKLNRFPDTMHAPLSPMVHAVLFKVIGANDFEKWRMAKKEKIYALDRIIAAVSIGFFMVALCISYFLAARIFDARIAGVMAILLLLCDLIWQFSLSGLPHMFMLMLMSAGLYFTYRGVENAAEGNSALGSVFSAAIFFVLLALTNWICIWVLIGFLVFTVVYFRPRGAVASFGILALLAGSAFNLYLNLSSTGSPLGTAFLTSYNSNPEYQEIFMRSTELGDVQFNFRNLLLNLLQTTFMQVTDIMTLLGGIIVAPLFFLSLLHPFKRKSIADFRWCVVLMWVLGTLGMTIFGMHDEISQNQIHILFAPIMTAYGLAIVSIFWARLGVASRVPMLGQLHFIAIVFISTAPLILNMVIQVKDVMVSAKSQEFRNGIAYPYFPYMMNAVINPLIPKTQAIATDQPEAVAWYADRTAVWLPGSIDQFKKVEEIATEQGHPVAAILVTPSSHATSPVISADFDNLNRRYRDFLPLITDGPISASVIGTDTFSILPAIKGEAMDDLRRRYFDKTPGTVSGRIMLLGGHLVLYRNNNETLLREARQVSRAKSEQEGGE